MIIANITSPIMETKGDDNMKNKNVDVLKIARIGGVVLSVGSMLVSSWVSNKEQEKTLKKLVDERLKNEK